MAKIQEVRKMKLNREICWLCIGKYKLPKIIVTENSCKEQTWDEFYNEFVMEWEEYGILDCVGIREHILLKKETGVLLAEKCPYFLEHVMNSEGIER